MNNFFYKSLFTFVCLMYQQYNYTFHELRMQLENQVVQIQIQTNEAFQIIWEAFLNGKQITDISLDVVFFINMC